jgi:hypothetical protein
MLQVPRMRIPVFVSAPSLANLSTEQDAVATKIYDMVARYRLEWRALGRSDYPLDLPLREVVRMVRHCSGGLVLGFEQFYAEEGTYKRHSDKPLTNANVVLPTPWNQLEGGMIYMSGLPLMILREPGIQGGIFDAGATELFVHDMPTMSMSQQAEEDFDAVFQRWVGRVKSHYYDE